MVYIQSRLLFLVILPGPRSFYACQQGYGVIGVITRKVEMCTFRFAIAWHTRLTDSQAAT